MRLIYYYHNVSSASDQAALAAAQLGYIVVLKVGYPLDVNGLRNLRHAADLADQINKIAAQLPITMKTYTVFCWSLLPWDTQHPDPLIGADALWNPQTLEKLFVQIPRYGKVALDVEAYSVLHYLVDSGITTAQAQAIRNTQAKVAQFVPQLELLIPVVGGIYAALTGQMQAKYCVDQTTYWKSSTKLAAGTIPGLAISLSDARAYTPQEAFYAFPRAPAVFLYPTPTSIAQAIALALPKNV